jgi:hypothetical protein
MEITVPDIDWDEQLELEDSEAELLKSSIFKIEAKKEDPAQGTNHGQSGFEKVK